MTKLRFWMLAGAMTAGFLLTASSADAGGGRKIIGGHPYHNGNYFIPPSSAYEGVRVYPPFRYGAPAYYFPGSYLPAGVAPFSFTTYPGTPFGRAGGYYLSTYGYYKTVNW